MPIPMNINDLGIEVTYRDVVCPYNCGSNLSDVFVMETDDWTGNADPERLAQILQFRFEDRVTNHLAWCPQCEQWVTCPDCKSYLGRVEIPLDQRGKLSPDDLATMLKALAEALVAAHTCKK